MIARIKTKNGCYDSAVFALFQKGRNWRAVVLNRNCNALETVNICPNKRKFFLYDTVKGEGWITERHAEGYDWVLKNTLRSLFKTVFRPPILTKCKSLQETVKKREWFSIETEDDLSGLMACTFHFHDSYVKNIDHQGETRYIRFDTIWDCEIILDLKEIFKPIYSKTSVVPPTRTANISRYPIPPCLLNTVVLTGSTRHPFKAVQNSKKPIFTSFAQTAFGGS